MANVYAWHGDIDRSVQQAEAAVAMSPYDAELRSLAFFLANAGNFDEAIEWSLWATAHDQQRNLWLKGTLAWAYYLAGRTEEALEAVKGTESFWGDLNVAIHARLGRIDEARAAAADWLKTAPHSILTQSCMPIREPMKQKYLDDLRKAGVPERAEKASP